MTENDFIDPRSRLNIGELELLDEIISQMPDAQVTLFYNNFTQRGHGSDLSRQVADIERDIKRKNGEELIWWYNCTTPEFFEYLHSPKNGGKNNNHRYLISLALAYTAKKTVCVLTPPGDDPLRKPDGIKSCWHDTELQLLLQLKQVHRIVHCWEESSPDGYVTVLKKVVWRGEASWDPLWDQSTVRRLGGDIYIPAEEQEETYKGGSEADPENEAGDVPEEVYHGNKADIIAKEEEEESDNSIRQVWISEGEASDERTSPSEDTEYKIDHYRRIGRILEEKRYCEHIKELEAKDIGLLVREEMRHQAHVKSSRSRRLRNAPAI
ncbi:hypothetical protein B0O99DRAFT_594356 [Bisporella sp. PMI_857]|nr:hypothetical protein B0O99DRAFT_594356 [Bisporella sp. PMI_857]